MTNVLNDMASYRRAWDRDALRSLSYGGHVAESRPMPRAKHDPCLLDWPLYDFSDPEAFREASERARPVEDELWDAMRGIEGLSVYTGPYNGGAIFSHFATKGDTFLWASFWCHSDVWYCVEPNHDDPAYLQAMWCKLIATLYVHLRDFPAQYVMPTPRDGDYSRSQAARAKHGRPPLPPVRYVSASAVRRIPIPAGRPDPARTGAAKSPHWTSAHWREYKEEIKRGPNAGKTRILVSRYAVRGGGPAPVTVVTP